MIGEMGLRVVEIFKENDIKFDPKVITVYQVNENLIGRGILNNLQGSTKTGELTVDILKDTPDTLIEYIKA